MTTIEFTTSEILLANCCVLCVARIILYCTTLSWRGSSVNLCKIATPHPLTTVWRQTSEIHTFYFFMQLCTVTAQFSLKWQIVRHPKCCVQQIGQNQLRRNICHRYFCFRCPDRYLFDPVTRLCQREAKVTCDTDLLTSLYYSPFNLLIVKLTEQDLSTFFSQELTLPRSRHSISNSINYPQYYQPWSTPSLQFVPGSFPAAFGYY